MGITSIVFIVILALCVVFDTLLGLIRGRNRSLLRLGLVALSAMLSFIIYKPITDAVINAEFGEFSINGLILETLANSDTPLPDSIYNFVFAFAEIILGVFVFVLVFLAIKFLTWIIAFPILKIFVHREEKKNAGLGALVGFAQGLLVAIIVCGTLSGFVVEANKLTAIKIDGEQMLELPSELGIQEYVDSPTAKVLNATGGWIFDIVSTTTDASGRKVSVSSICNTATTLLNVTNEITNAYSSMDNVGNSDGETNVEALKNMGDAFINVGTAIEELDEDSRVLVNDLIDDVKEIAATALGELPPELETMIDSIDAEEIKIKSAGEALNAMVKYVEDGYANDGTAPNLTQEDVDDIVNGIADNMFLLDMLGGNNATLLEVDDLNADKFNTAIENANLTQEEKDILRNIFSLN